MAYRHTGITGVDNVLKNLNKEINGIKKRTMPGLIEAAILIRRSMDEQEPKIPVGETGFLRGSWDVQPMKSSKGPMLRLGFSAEYAWYVHEMVGANFRRPGAGAKFFEASLKRNKKKSLEAIQRQAKGK